MGNKQLPEPPYHEYRWAIVSTGTPERFILGKFCWDQANWDEPKKRTFRTRQLARDAKKLLGSYRVRSRIVRVTVTVSEEDLEPTAKT